MANATNSSTPMGPVDIVAGVTELCVDGVLKPVEEDMLDPRNPNR